LPRNVLDVQSLCASLSPFFLACTSLAGALHKLRFGDVSAGEAPRKTPAEKAQQASKALMLVDIIRLAGNLMYKNADMQELARQTNGLQILSSHCYSDHELPMLREVGVFAIRNATYGNLANQEEIRKILSQRKQTAASQSPDAGAPTPAIAEFGFDV